MNETLAMTIGFLFFLAGIIWRTVRPYMKKLQEQNARNAVLAEKGLPLEPSMKFDERFLMSATITFTSCVVIALLGMAAGGAASQSIRALLADPLSNAVLLFAGGVAAQETFNKELL